MKKIIVIFIGIMVVSLIGASDQLFVPCGGDSELQIQCIGDDQLGIFGNMERREMGGDIAYLGFLGKINKKSILIITGSVLFFLFLVIISIIVDKKKKIRILNTSSKNIKFK